MKRIGQGIGIIIGLMAFSMTAAQAEPPIRSAEDAVCRAEAKARVFAAPNPRNLPLEEVGKGIYFKCMDRIGGKPARKRGRRHHAR